MPLNADYHKILQKARGNQKLNKEFLHRLKKKRPNNLDWITNAFHAKAFEEIDCLKCANCCTTTGPLLKSRDITTLSDKIKISSSVFSERFLKTDEDGDMVFQKLPCPFLGDDHYCSVYDARPGACRDYPHTHQRDIAEKLPITFLNSMICPAVALVVENLKKHYTEI